MDGHYILNLHLLETAGLQGLAIYVPANELRSPQPRAPRLAILISTRWYGHPVPVIFACKNPLAPWIASQCKSPFDSPFAPRGSDRAVDETVQTEEEEDEEAPPGRICHGSGP